MMPKSKKFKTSGLSPHWTTCVKKKHETNMANTEQMIARYIFKNARARKKGEKYLDPSC
jgi:hypothetical protein